MLRGTAAAIVVATSLAASALGATAIRGRNAARRASAAAATPAAIGPTKSVASDSRSDSTATASAQVAPASTAASPTPTATTPSTTPPNTAAAVVASAPTKAPVAPVIPAGTSPLPDGVTASRTDSLVTVSFDIPLVRTRIPEKFERFVRTTLPTIYGPGIDSALAALPSGALARQGDLVTQLPSAGVRVAVAPAWELRVFPETRKGVDGPLVVRYRAVVCAKTDASCGVH